MAPPRRRRRPLLPLLLATLLLLLLPAMANAEEAGPLADGEVGAPCLRGGRCHVLHARCEDGVCACLPHLVPSARGRRCLPVAEALGAACEEDTQCAAEHAFCRRRTRVCACRRGHVEGGGRCLREAALGEACEHAAQCVPVALTECSDARQRCVCRGIAFEARGRCVTDDPHAPGGVADWEPTVPANAAADSRSTLSFIGVLSSVVLVLAFQKVQQHIDVRGFHIM